MQDVLTLAIKFWSFGSPGGLPNPNFGSVNFILTLSQSRVATILDFKKCFWFQCSSLKKCMWNFCWPSTNELDLGVSTCQVGYMLWFNKKKFIDIQTGVVDGHDPLKPIVPNTWCVCVCVCVCFNKNGRYQNYL